MGTAQLLDLFHVSDLSSQPQQGGGEGKEAAIALADMCDHDDHYDDYNVEGFLKSVA
jgi:hypothetical protein